MYDHIHRQIANTRIADQRRAHAYVSDRRGVRSKAPPWIRRHIIR